MAAKNKVAPNKNLNEGILCTNSCLHYDTS